jgi:4-amino-4-deoxy-L-arabinose transferase-like glycosyltransferase
VSTEEVPRDAGARQTRPRARLALGTLVLVLVVAVICWFFWGGAFRFQPEHGETFWHLLHQSSGICCTRRDIGSWRS